LPFSFILEAGLASIIKGATWVHKFGKDPFLGVLKSPEVSR